MGTQSGVTLTENGPTSFMETGGLGGSFVTDTSLGGEYLKPLMDGPNGSLSNYIFATSGSPCCDASDVRVYPRRQLIQDFLGFARYLQPDHAEQRRHDLRHHNPQSVDHGLGDNAGTRWWEISDTTPFDGWVASSSGVAFEFDLNVPEPSTWAMMGLGFAGLGFAAFRRSAKTPAAMA